MQPSQKADSPVESGTPQISQSGGKTKSNAAEQEFATNRFNSNRSRLVISRYATSCPAIGLVVDPTLHVRLRIAGLTQNGIQGRIQCGVVLMIFRVNAEDAEADR